MNHAKDPLLWLSCVLAALGALQASTSLLSALAAKYPITFGLVMTGISVSTAVLTIYRNAKAAQLVAEADAIRVLHAARDHEGSDDGHGA